MVRPGRRPEVFKLGKTPARNLMGFKFGDFVDKTKLPDPPLTFKRRGIVPLWFGLGNDLYSNCVWAGAAHETMLATLQGGHPRARFTIKDVNSDYSAVTGFDPAHPLTDQGTDMLEAASYRRKTGILDALGNRHTIDSYMALRVGDFDELIDAVYLTGGVGVGMHFPQSAFEQFDANQPWTVVPGSPIVGGHYVSVYDREKNGNLCCVTFGRDQEITREFYEAMNDETCCYVNLERMVNAVSPEAFDTDRLTTMLAQL
jgi:hypothetical protein